MPMLNDQQATTAAAATTPAPTATAPTPAGPTPAGPTGPALTPGGVEQVDPTAPAVEGQLPTDFKEEQATPEEQKEYERAMNALVKVLYSNDKTADAVVDQVQIEDRVGSTSKALILLIQQLDEKIDMDESVVAQITQEATARLMELVETRHGIQYGDRETQVIMGAVWEGVQEMFGVDEAGIQGLVSGMSEQGLAQLKQQHEGFLNG